MLLPLQAVGARHGVGSEPPLTSFRGEATASELALDIVCNLNCGPYSKAMITRELS